MFDWKRVEEEVRVITPEFQVWKDGQLKTIVIYAKMCRGAMTRYLLQNRINNADKLKSFDFEGFSYSEVRQQTRLSGVCRKSIKRLKA